MLVGLSGGALVGERWDKVLQQAGVKGGGTRRVRVGQLEVLPCTLLNHIYYIH